VTPFTRVFFFLQERKPRGVHIFSQNLGADALYGWGVVSFFFFSIRNTLIFRFPTLPHEGFFFFVLIFFFFRTPVETTLFFPPLPTVLFLFVYTSHIFVFPFVVWTFCGTVFWILISDPPPLPAIKTSLICLPYKYFPGANFSPFGTCTCFISNPRLLYLPPPKPSPLQVLVFRARFFVLPPPPTEMSRFLSNPPRLVKPFFD